MNKNIIVNVHNSEFLSKMIQEFAFSKGYTWPGPKNKLVYDEYPINNYGREGAAILLGDDKIMRYCPFAYFRGEIAYRNDIFIDANTELGKLWDLFKEPEYEIPEINGYKAEYKKGSSIVKFGCAEIPLGMLYNLIAEWGYSSGNRKIVSFTLNSGVTFTKDDAQKVIDYVRYIDDKK